MSKSLQEQLLASGLAKPKQAKKARREKAAQTRAARQRGEQPGRAPGRGLSEAERAKRARDRQLNAEREMQRAAREREQSILQTIESNRVPTGGEDEAAVDYSYSHGKRIRRLRVADARRRELAAGRLGIVRFGGTTALLPKEVALRLREQIPDRVWLVEADDSPSDPDDPYAAYQVPDDLMW